MYPAVISKYDFCRNFGIWYLLSIFFCSTSLLFICWASAKLKLKRETNIKQKINRGSFLLIISVKVLRLLLTPNLWIFFSHTIYKKRKAGHFHLPSIFCDHKPFWIYESFCGKQGDHDPQFLHFCLQFGLLWHSHSL